MTYGSVSFLFMGDANADAESRIANSGTNLRADILKVGHYGSATSSSSAFLSIAQPKTSVIEVRAGNSYGPPTSATLGRLAQVGSAVYRTDLNGNVNCDNRRQDVRCQNRTGKQPASMQSSAGAVSPCLNHRWFSWPQFHNISEQTVADRSHRRYGSTL